MFRWAVKKGYLDRSPIVDSETITRQRTAQRTRRLVADVVDPKTGKILQAGEERALLAVAGPHLQPSRAVVRSIDLHFHDLRHEAGSRFIEVGWPIHHVQEMLGHKNVSQTSTYLNMTRIGLQESMRKFDELGGRCWIIASDLEIGRTPFLQRHR